MTEREPGKKPQCTWTVKKSCGGNEGVKMDERSCQAGQNKE